MKEDRFRMSKSIIDLGIEAWDDVLMCKHLGLRSPSIEINPCFPMSTLDIGKVFKPDVQLVDYWKERAKWRGYQETAQMREIKKISILVEKKGVME